MYVFIEASSFAIPAILTSIGVEPEIAYGELSLAVIEFIVATGFTPELLSTLTTILE